MVNCDKCQDTGVMDGWVSPDGDYDFEACDELCITCHENTHIDGFRCFGCSIDYHYSEGVDSELFTTQEAK